jgi:hypothetical protein
VLLTDRQRHFLLRSSSVYRSSMGNFFFYWFTDEIYGNQSLGYYLIFNIIFQMHRTSVIVTFLLFIVNIHQMLRPNWPTLRVEVSLIQQMLLLPLLKRLPVVKALDSFPAVYGTRRLITAYTRAVHLSLWSLS